VKRRKFIKHLGVALAAAAVPAIALSAVPELTLPQKMDAIWKQYAYPQIRSGKMIIIQTRWHNGDLYERLSLEQAMNQNRWLVGMNNQDWHGWSIVDDVP